MLVDRSLDLDSVGTFVSGNGDRPVSPQQRQLSMDSGLMESAGSNASPASGVQGNRRRERKSIGVCNKISSLQFCSRLYLVIELLDHILMCKL